MPSRNLDNASMNGSGSGSGGKPMIRQTGCLQSAANNRVLTCNIGEGRGGKRLQKNSSNNPTPARPAEPTPAAAMRNEPFSVPATRRRQSSFRDQTFRDQRALPTSTSLQASPSKRHERLFLICVHIANIYRLAYNGLSNPQAPQRTFASNSSQEPHSRQNSYGHSSRFSFSPAAPVGRKDVSHEPESFDFLPPINFDDFHASIGTGEPDINSFPKPGGSLAGTANGSSSIHQRPGMNGPSKSIDTSQIGSRIGLNGSSIRRHDNNVRQPSQTNADPGPMAPPAAAASARARRKTYFATPATGSAVPRAPRKSVGPGILTLDLTGQGSTHRRPSLAQAGLGEAKKSPEVPESPGGRTVSGGKPGYFDLSTRQTKTKSLQPPPKTFSETERFSTPMGTPEQPFHSPVGTGQSPARPRLQRTTTPSSSKRISIMPGTAHATGLGARTISPTDARRLKRMSMMPNAPPMPFTPPTPQPDPPSTGRPYAPSPSMIPRKSVTPSSSRTTPDPNRKSYSSGVSNSSTTSYNSFLASTGSSRISQSFSTSRLPTPKTRNDNASIGDEEIVPPVPAIPKAYESPKGEFEQPPFFTARKSSMGLDVSSLHSLSTSGDLPSPCDPEPPKVERQSRYKVGDTDPAKERKPSGGANTNRRTLQPLRLPPLNLLPLSTPTASRIAALYDGSATNNARAATPPPKDGSKGAPTTPMTASKASFSRNYYEDDNATMSAQVRSSSSHFNMIPDALSYHAASTSSTPASNPPDSFTLPVSRPAMSPFLSSSLPKVSGDFGYGLEKANTLDGAETRTTKPTGPRLQKPRKVSKDDASSLDTTSSVDTTTQSIGSTIRRKLSLTRKRSNSKAQTAAERDADPPPKPPKHDNMPPPRLPASATWSGPLPSPSPSQQSGQSRATRNTPVAGSNAQHDRTRNTVCENGEIIKKDSATPAAKRTARANLEGTPSQNALSLKDFLKEAKTMEAQLDRDDLSAEEEMKKLALKRKETEKAAQEVDALRRRATAKDRVSPNSALRMANLNIFERGEIVDYKDIYFCGTRDAKKHVGDLSTEVANFGYDDERGDYNIVTGDHLAYRYEIVDILGKGSFGQVVRCVDHKTGGLVAIKIIRNKKRFHQQALVEVDILQKLREWVSSVIQNSDSITLLIGRLGSRG